MQNYSLAGIGTYTAIIGLVLANLGIDFETEVLEQAVQGGVTLVGFVLMVIGQFKRRDLTFGLFRKG